MANKLLVIDAAQHHENGLSVFMTNMLLYKSMMSLPTQAVRSRGMVFYASSNHDLTQSVFPRTERGPQGWN